MEMREREETCLQLGQGAELLISAMNPTGGRGR